MLAPPLSNYWGACPPPPPGPPSSYAYAISYMDTNNGFLYSQHFRMLELINNRVLEELTNTWWDSNELKKECPRIEDETDGISIKNIGGVFLVIVIGTGLSLIVLIAESYYYKIRPDREARAYNINRKMRQHLNGMESGTSLDTLNTHAIGNGSTVTLDTMDTKVENGDFSYFTYGSTSNGINHRGFSDDRYQGDDRLQTAKL